MPDIELRIAPIAMYALSRKWLNTKNDMLIGDIAVVFLELLDGLKNYFQFCRIRDFTAFHLIASTIRCCERLFPLLTAKLSFPIPVAIFSDHFVS